VQETLEPIAQGSEELEAVTYTYYNEYSSPEQEQMLQQLTAFGLTITENPYYTQ
jgi:hypothetical protein